MTIPPTSLFKPNTFYDVSGRRLGNGSIVLRNDSGVVALYMDKDCTMPYPSPTMFNSDGELAAYTKSDFTEVEIRDFRGILQSITKGIEWPTSLDGEAIAEARRQLKGTCLEHNVLAHRLLVDKLEADTREPRGGEPDGNL